MMLLKRGTKVTRVTEKVSRIQRGEEKWVCLIRRTVK